MTPEQARADYRDALDLVGGSITLRRGSGPGAPERTFKARVAGYDPSEITGDVQQGDSRVIFLADDIEGYPLPLESQGRDAIFINGAKRTIRAIDDRTRAVGGVLIAYDLRVRG